MRILLGFALVAVAHAGATRADHQAPAPSAVTPDGAGSPVVSPDGKWIVFRATRGGQDDLYLVGSDGTGERRLTETPEREALPQWSRDGREIIYGTGGQDSTVLSVTTIGDGTTRVLARLSGRGAAMAPDGETVLRSIGGFTAARLVLSRLDGLGERYITDDSGSAFNAAWSPDGSHVAFTRLAPDRSIGVWIVSADGTGARPITHLTPAQGRAQWPAWSPDDRRIAVQVGQAGGVRGNAHIAVIDLASGRLTALAPHERAWLDETPSWFPDGRLAFQSDRSGRMEVWVMNGDGSAARQVTHSPGAAGARPHGSRWARLDTVRP